MARRYKQSFKIPTTQRHYRVEFYYVNVQGETKPGVAVVQAASGCLAGFRVGAALPADNRYDEVRVIGPYACYDDAAQWINKTIQMEMPAEGPPSKR